MAINFKIPNTKLPVNARTLAKGFGLPLVKRAFLNVKEVGQGDKPDGTSLFGTPLYGTMFIERPEYSEFDYDEVNKKYVETTVILSDNKTIGNVVGVFMDGVIIDVNQKRNVVTTEIAGMDGSVKEFINNGDFNISIRGYFADPNPDKYPAVSVRALNTYLKAPVPLKVTNVYLNDYFGVVNIVPISYSFHQEEGVRNVQYFEIECLSDVPFEILEKNG